MATATEISASARAGSACMYLPRQSRSARNACAPACPFWLSTDSQCLAERHVGLDALALELELGELELGVLVAEERATAFAQIVHGALASRA